MRSSGRGRLSGEVMWPRRRKEKLGEEDDKVPLRACFLFPLSFVSVLIFA